MPIHSEDDLARRIQSILDARDGMRAAAAQRQMLLRESYQQEFMAGLERLLGELRRPQTPAGLAAEARRRLAEHGLAAE